MKAGSFITTSAAVLFLIPSFYVNHFCCRAKTVRFSEMCSVTQEKRSDMWIAQFILDQSHLLER